MKRLLWVGDAACPTGFARVTHSVTERLKAKWDVHILGLNYNGDPHDHQGIKIYPADRGGDFWGVQRIGNLIGYLNPDVVLILQDPWRVVPYFAGIPFSQPVCAYMPVDAEHMKPIIGRALHRLTTAIWYTEFGANEARLAGYRGPYEIIPHGVDPAFFCPMVKREAREKLGLPAIFNEAFIVGNVNSINPRKRMDLTIRYFATWIREYQPKNAILYLHCNIKDGRSYDLIDLKDYYGVGDRVIFPDFGDGIALLESHMPYVYNSFDVQVSTTQGEGWGLCVAPETMIQVPNGAKPMREILPGDLVMSGDGSYRLVRNKIGRFDKTLRIKASGLPVLRVTAQHPFLVLPRRADRKEYYARHPEEMPAWTRADQLKTGDLIACPRPNWSIPLPESFDLAVLGGQRMCFDETHVWLKTGYSPKNASPSLTEISDRFCVSKRVAEDARAIASGYPRAGRGGPGSCALAVAEQLGPVPAPQQVRLKRFVPFTDRTLELLGWYLAEGNVSGMNRVEIDLHRREYPIAERLSESIEELFGLQATIEFNGPNKCRLRVCSRILARFFRYLCGSGERRKRLAPILVQSAVHLAPMIHAYFRGDGHRAITWAITTASTVLAWQLRMVLAAAEIHSGIFHSRKRSVWVVSVGGDALERFGKWIRTPVPAGRSRAAGTTALIRDDYIFVPVRKIEAESLETEVMDIEVDGTHCFVGNGAVLHNTTMEGMACKVPQIVPDYAALGEWAKGVAKLVPVTDLVPTPIEGINTMGGIPSEEAFVDALQSLYTNERLRHRYAVDGWHRVKEARYRWDTVAEQFDRVLTEAAERRRAA